MEYWKCSLENLGLAPNFWVNKNVYITGHSGFKGSWLSLALNELGASLYGYSLPPKPDPNLFNTLDLLKIFRKSQSADILDINELEASLISSSPDIIFHLAAQPLISESYLDPYQNYKTNVLGTLNLLESIRKINLDVKTIIIITSDKCYLNNQNADHSFGETDALGGDDPYSSSKACVEIITNAYQKSFFSKTDTSLATVRAGNVIGGGDWSSNRLIPDIFRAIESKKVLQVRNPDSIRPWQHVLEPIFGYIKLAERSFYSKKFEGPWNFGPAAESHKSVSWIINNVKVKFPNLQTEKIYDELFSEKQILKLDSSKAERELNFKSKWDLRESLNKTFEWYTHWQSGSEMFSFSQKQIKQYLEE